MNKNHKGFSPIIVVVLVGVVVAVIAFIFLSGGSNGLGLRAPESGLGNLPPANQRTNPAPDSGYSIYVDEVRPGSEVTVNDLVVREDVYVVVQSSDDNRKLLGVSELVRVGANSNVLVMTDELVNGQAIYVGLQNVDRRPILDENGNAIEILVNVGSLSGHQQGQPLDPEDSYY